MKMLSWLIPIFCLGSSFATGQPGLKVGLVLDKGGKDDKSFNASAYRGASLAKEKLGIHLKVLECSSDSALAPSLKTFAQHGYDLIIGVGFVQKSPLEEVARLFPQTKFLLVDAPSTLPNVRSVLFQEHEGSFLVGYIAALKSNQKPVGFIGGMDIPLIRRFEMGYRAGARTAQPTLGVFSHYVGASSEAWRNPSKAKELALLQFSQGAEVIFCAAGSSCLGVFDAADEKKKFAIGVDSNQNWVKPGTILTSMVKAVDAAVYQTIELTQRNRFLAGPTILGLKEDGVSYSIDEHNRAVLSPSIELKARSIREQLIRGTLQAPDYYQISKTSRPKND
ncbi:BMP family ABC transporter substrate-binding protein [bacterium]|nr:BMP family ABC transporter substrate-binding protein [bacterium]